MAGTAGREMQLRFSAASPLGCCHIVRANKQRCLPRHLWLGGAAQGKHALGRASRLVAAKAKAAVVVNRS